MLFVFDKKYTEDCDVCTFYTSSIIEWNQQDRNTLKAEIESGGSYTLINKCWLNEKLVWESDKRQERIFTVIK